MDVNKIKNNPVHPRVHPGTDPLRPLREQCKNNVNVCRRVRSPGRAGDFGFDRARAPAAPVDDVRELRIKSKTLTL